MEPQSSLTDNDVLVVDTSVVINLNATGYAKEILDALPQRIAVVNVIIDELEYGRSKGRGDAAMFAELVKAGVITVVSLGEAALPQFESLVVGASAETLDDGEAATIAYAIDTNASVIIDERKARRLCSNRFPHIQLGCTLDLLSHQAVQHALGQARLANALHKALLSARMRVLPHFVNWVVNLIGNERAAACHCLPETVRQAARNA